MVAAVEIEATRLDGSSVRGELVELTPDITLQTATDQVTLEWAEVISLQPVTASDATADRSQAAAPFRFHLADGSRFCGRVSDGPDGRLELRFEQGGVCHPGLSVIHSVVSTTANTVALARLAEVARERGVPLDGETVTSSAPNSTQRLSAGVLDDVAVVARGEEAVVLRGTVRQLTAQRVRFLWQQREVNLPWSKLVGLLLARQPAQPATCLVRLHGGDVFAGRISAGSGAAITLQSKLFADLELPWERIERIDCRSARLVFLSDLTPARYEFEPFFDKRWNYAFDKTLSGRPIRLAGQEYARGVALHSRATLTFLLDGGYRQFAAVAGIADEMGKRGCVTLRVLGDERVLWEQAGIRGGGPPAQVIVNLTGVRELSLQVDYDDELDLADHACWAFARLIRAGQNSE